VLFSAPHAAIAAIAAVAAALFENRAIRSSSEGHSDHCNYAGGKSDKLP